MYSPEDLAALVAIADTGSLRAAAHAVRRTQPAVTQAIQRLESAVGFALLDRSGYRARLSEHGETFAKRARLAIEQARDLEALASLLARGTEPRLRIVYHAAIPSERWLHLTRGVAEQYPDTVLELEAAEGDAPVRRLLAGEAQLALILHHIPDRYGLQVDSQALGELEFVTVVRADRICELQAGRIPQILVADFEDRVTAYGVAEGQRHWRVSNHALKARTILGGDGWGSVPSTLVAQELQRGTLQAISHLGLRERTPVSFALHRKRDQRQGPVASFVWGNAAATR